jgi:tRNA-uridine 2-sulfurtransferase
MRCTTFLRTSQKIILGMSGGVDSSVAAFLLLRQGYEVEGVYMRNWDIREESDTCNGDKDYEDVQKVCRQLDIQCHEVNFVKPYWNRVFGEFLVDYTNGKTPNPDIFCNKEIKFRCFLDYALNQRQGYMIASGHYVRTRGNQLLRGIDRTKDQSYFLSQVTFEALKHSLFPVGHLTKEEVRKYATSLGLVTANKKESMGICFIGKRSFTQFIRQYVPHPSGEFLSLDGKILGEHKGLCSYTIGQNAAIAGQALR